jgi:hypothetical protein
VLTLLRTIFDQPEADQVHAQFDRVVDALIEKLPAVAEHLDGARARPARLPSRRLRTVVANVGLRRWCFGGFLGLVVGA